MADPCELCDGSPGVLECLDCGLLLCEANSCCSSLHQPEKLKGHSFKRVNEISGKAEGNAMNLQEALKEINNKTQSQTATAAASAASSVCELCEEKQSEYDCVECSMQYCSDCNREIHQPTAMKHHNRKPIGGSAVQLPLCEVCEEHESSVHCSDCAMFLCDAGNCNKDVHGPQKKKGHKIIPAKQFLEEQSKDKAAKETIAEAPKAVCENCDDLAAVIECSDCDLALCSACEAALHQPAKMQKHNRKQISAKATEQTQQAAKVQPQPQSRPPSQSGAVSSSLKAPASGSVASRPSSPSAPRPLTPSSDSAPLPSVSEPSLPPVSVSSEICELCDVRSSLFHCGDCLMDLCPDCDRELHTKPAGNPKHKRAPLIGKSTQTQEKKQENDKISDGASGELCENCDESAASVDCAECELSLCSQCEAELHAPVKMKAHKRTAKPSKQKTGDSKPEIKAANSAKPIAAAAETAKPEALAAPTVTQPKQETPKVASPSPAPAPVPVPVPVAAAVAVPSSPAVVPPPVSPPPIPAVAPASAPESISPAPQPSSIADSSARQSPSPVQPFVPVSVAPVSSSSVSPSPSGRDVSSGPTASSPPALSNSPPPSASLPASPSPVHPVIFVIPPTPASSISTPVPLHSPSSGSVPLSDAICSLCSECAPNVFCPACNLYLCFSNGCDAEIHRATATKAHQRTAINSANREKDEQKESEQTTANEDQTQKAAIAAIAPSSSAASRAPSRFPSQRPSRTSTPAPVAVQQPSEPKPLAASPSPRAASVAPAVSASVGRSASHAPTPTAASRAASRSGSPSAKKLAARPSSPAQPAKVASGNSKLIQNSTSPSLSPAPAAAPTLSLSPSSLELLVSNAVVAALSDSSRLASLIHALNPNPNLSAAQRPNGHSIGGRTRKAQTAETKKTEKKSPIKHSDHQPIKAWQEKKAEVNEEARAKEIGTKSEQTIAATESDQIAQKASEEFKSRDASLPLRSNSTREPPVLFNLSPAVIGSASELSGDGDSLALIDERIHQRKMRRIKRERVREKAHHQVEEAIHNLIRSNAAGADKIAEGNKKYIKQADSEDDQAIQQPQVHYHHSHPARPQPQPQPSDSDYLHSQPHPAASGGSHSTSSASALISQLRREAVEESEKLRFQWRRAPLYQPIQSQGQGQGQGQGQSQTAVQPQYPQAVPYGASYPNAFPSHYVMQQPAAILSTGYPMPSPVPVSVPVSMASPAYPFSRPYSARPATSHPPSHSHQPRPPNPISSPYAVPAPYSQSHLQSQEHLRSHSHSLTLTAFPQSPAQHAPAPPHSHSHFRSHSHPPLPTFPSQFPISSHPPSHVPSYASRLVPSDSVSSLSSLNPADFSSQWSDSDASGRSMPVAAASVSRASRTHRFKSSATARFERA